MKKRKLKYKYKQTTPQKKAFQDFCLTEKQETLDAKQKLNEESLIDFYENENIFRETEERWDVTTHFFSRKSKTFQNNKTQYESNDFNKQILQNNSVVEKKKKSSHLSTEKLQKFKLKARKQYTEGCESRVPVRRGSPLKLMVVTPEKIQDNFFEISKEKLRNHQIFQKRIHENTQQRKNSIIQKAPEPSYFELKRTLVPYGNGGCGLSLFFHQKNFKMRNKKLNWTNNKNKEVRSLKNKETLSTKNDLERLRKLINFEYGNRNYCFEQSPIKISKI